MEHVRGQTPSDSFEPPQANFAVLETLLKWMMFDNCKCGGWWRVYKSSKPSIWKRYAESVSTERV
jgi:hypothetical protein